MNTNKTLSIIIPHILIVAVFAAMSQLALYGFMTPLESQTLSALDALSRGEDFYSASWGSASAFAPILQPLWMLATALCGGSDGIAYIMRIIVIAADFVVALAGYRVLSERVGRMSSLLLALAYLVLASCGARAFGPYGLGLTSTFIASLFAWAAYVAALDDDGLSTGYMRVLRPVLAGFFFACAFVFSLSACVAFVLVLIAFLAGDKVLDRPNARVLVAWMLCGAVLAAATYMILVLGYGEPGEVLGAIFAGAGSSSSGPHERITVETLAELAAFGVVLCPVLFAICHEDTDTLGRAVAAVFGIAVIGAVVLFANTRLAAVTDGVRIQDGPAKELICAPDDVQRCEDVTELARKADAASVHIIGEQEDMWVYLLFKGERSDSEPSWLLKLSGTTDVKEILALQDCGKIAGNDSGELYRRASAIGTISQG